MASVSEGSLYANVSSLLNKIVESSWRLWRIKPGNARRVWRNEPLHHMFINFRHLLLVTCHLRLGQIQRRQLGKIRKAELA